MPKNGSDAELPCASLRSALSDCTDGSTLMACDLISQAVLRSSSGVGSPPLTDGGRVTSTCKGRLVSGPVGTTIK
jgi:hypothetical protein